MSFEPPRRNAGMMSKAIFLMVALLQLAAAETFDHYQGAKDYDAYFRQYSEHCFGSDFDWRYFKAQAIAESRLQERARSHAGAVGVMQILPTTFEEIRLNNPMVEDDPWHPRWNIAAAILYNRMLWETWQAERPRHDRICFMLGSYNAGKQTIIKAQNEALKMGLDPNRWQSVEQALPKVIGAAYGETIAYVRIILKIRQALKWETNQIIIPNIEIFE